MPGSISTFFATAPSSPTSSGTTTPTRRRSSIFSGIASLGGGSSTSSSSQGRRGSKFSISSCFSESSNPDRNEPSAQHDCYAPGSPLNASFDQSTIARRASYVPKRAAESFSISTTPLYAREAGAASANSLTSKRISYATQYGFKTPRDSIAMETVPDNKL